MENIFTQKESPFSDQSAVLFLPQYSKKFDSSLFLNRKLYKSLNDKN